MKYETPEMTALTPAVSAIQGTISKTHVDQGDSYPELNESASAYADWE